MPIENSVHFYHSGMTGAPVLSGQLGSMIGVLDACLVNGWGTATVDSVVIAGGVATVTRASGHPFEADMVAEFSGAVVTGGTFNGERKVIARLSTTQYTVDADGLPNQTAGGTISHKVSSAGWQKAFTGTNLAAYRSQDVTGNRFYLRVDDSNNYNARALGYEVMTDINTGTGMFPTTATISGGWRWPRSNETSAGSSPRQWTLFANSKFFILAVNWSSAEGANTNGFCSAFGDLVRPAGSTDAYATMLHGSNSDSLYGTSPGTNSTEHINSGSAGSILPRPAFALGQPIAAFRSYAMLCNNTNGTYSGDTSTNHITFPNPADGGVFIGEFFCVDANYTYRGKWPGFYGIPQRCGPLSFTNRQRLTSVASLPGRAVRILNTGYGAVAFDATGPWS